jgi:hypothetical protein
LDRHDGLTLDSLTLDSLTLDWLTLDWLVDRSSGHRRGRGFSEQACAQ